MLLAAELVNDNGISTVALAFFSALLTAVTATVIGVFQIKQKAVEAKNVALETKQDAQQARINTENVGNGFTSEVGRKLDTIMSNQDDLSKAFREHLTWHLKNSGKDS